jgi:hypothetical protein
MRMCTDEVVAPHMAGMCRPQPHTRPIIELQPSARLLLFRYLQPYATPDRGLHGQVFVRGVEHRRSGLRSFPRRCPSTPASQDSVH